jgi:hypothetical protein
MQNRYTKFANGIVPLVNGMFSALKVNARPSGAFQAEVSPP